MSGAPRPKFFCGTDYAQSAAVFISQRPMHRSTLVTWLDDAYAMETQSLPALCGRAVAAHAVAEASSRIEEHIHETKWHIERLRQAL